MASDRTSASLWLPITFLLEVALWEADASLGLELADPSWEMVGDWLGVERIAYGLAVATVVLTGLFLLVTRRRSVAQRSTVLLFGVLGMGCYWIGASVVSSGLAVLLAAVGSWLLARRGEAL